jgi:hypothetical protein
MLVQLKESGLSFVVRGLEQQRLAWDAWLLQGATFLYLAYVSVLCIHQFGVENGITAYKFCSFTHATLCAINWMGRAAYYTHMQEGRAQ